MNKKKKSRGLLIYIVTPLILLLVCTAILVLTGIKPYNKLSVYLNLAFMDEFKTTPDEGIAGLTIKENDIDTQYGGETYAEGEITRPTFGEQYAVLRADKLEVAVPVFWGSTDELFDRGACHATYSKLPGEEGNAVISAHVDTFFADLSLLEAGDVITLNTSYGEFIYTVTEQISFKKTSKKYVSATEDTRLTLYTCKRDVLGASEDRIGVICELTESKFYEPKKEEE